MTKSGKTKQIKYSIDCDEARKFPLILFDILGLKENLVINFFRAANLMVDGIVDDFCKKVNCKIIRDVTRSDSFCIFIPKINSNIELYPLIEQLLDASEFTFLPGITDLETLCFSLHNIFRKNSIEYGVCQFEAHYDMEFGITFFFDNDYFETMKIENQLKEWEKTLIGFEWERDPKDTSGLTPKEVKRLRKKLSIDRK